MTIYQETGAARTVDDAYQELEDVYADLHEARQTLMQATIQLMASQGITIGQRSYGALYQTDPETNILKQAVIDAESRYRYVWNVAIPEAKEQLQRLEQQVLLHDREAWAQATCPDIVRTIMELRELIHQGVPDSRQVYVAKHQLQQAQFQLQQLWAKSQEK